MSESATRRRGVCTGSCLATAGGRVGPAPKWAAATARYQVETTTSRIDRDRARGPPITPDIVRDADTYRANASGPACRRVKGSRS